MGKTGPACRVCEHQHRHVIELGLVHRVPVRVLAKRFALSKDSIFRHRRRHMSPQLKAALLAAMRPSEIDLDQLREAESRGLLGSLVAQRARLQMLSEAAFERGELHAATSVERAITNSLELTSRLLGMMVTRHEVSHVNVLLSPSYLKLRQALTTVLRKHPEAARDVASALAQLELEAAEQISESKRPILLEASPC